MSRFVSLFVLAMVALSASASINPADMIRSSKSHPYGKATASRTHRPAKAPALHSAKSEAVGAPNIYGSLVYSMEWDYIFDDQIVVTGIYSIPTEAPYSITPIALDSNLEANGGGVLAGDKYIMTYFFQYMGYPYVFNDVFDAETWEMISDTQTDEPTSIAADMAYDTESKKIYGSFFNEAMDGQQFGILDTETWTSSCIRDLGKETWLGMDFDSKGTLYAINNSGEFLRVDKNTGESEKISDTGLYSAYYSSAVIDKATDTFYFLVCWADETSSFYAIDVATGEPSLVYELDNAEEICGFFIPEPKQHDLAARTLTAPTSVIAGSDLQIQYTVANWGTEDAAGYSATIYCDGNIVRTDTDLPALAPGEKYEGAFTHSFDAVDAGMHQFYVYVNYDADQDFSNNESTVANVYVAQNDFPTVILTGKLDEATDKPLISWQAPDADDQPVCLTESFENANYPSFSIDSFGPWTLDCTNTTNTYTIYGISFPNESKPFGWILFDPAALGIYNDIWAAPDGGGRMLAAFAHMEGANGAWLISPLLPGSAQTVTFMAKQLTDEFGGETISAYYSSTDNARSSFTKLDINGYSRTLTTEWNSYSIDLPNGAKYFALESTSAGQWITLLDDITYCGYSPYSDLAVVGYNVYRNGSLITPEPIQATEYLDADAPEGEISYAVGVVYEQGLSRLSAPCVFGNSGVASMLASAQIRVEGNTIIVENAPNASISTVAGALVPLNRHSGYCTATVPAGLYIVKTGSAVAKVIVK